MLLPPRSPPLRPSLRLTRPNHYYPPPPEFPVDRLAPSLLLVRLPLQPPPLRRAQPVQRDPRRVKTKKLRPPPHPAPLSPKFPRSPLPEEHSSPFAPAQS